MSVFIESAESKFDFTYVNEQIDNAIQSRDIKYILKDFTGVEQIQYILYKYPTYITEECLLKLLRHRDTYISYKSFSLLTDFYKHNEHKKEYFVFLKYMLMEDSTYEEKNQLLSLFIVFISGKSNKFFDIEKRKSQIIMDDHFIDILNKMIIVKELQYNILVILFVFSFTEKYILRVCKFFRKLISILKDRSREKILRICYSVLVNILNSEYKLTINQIYEMRKITTILCDSNIGDESLVENIKISKKLLDIKHSEYSIEQYISDLFKGILEEHDYHYDDVFWQNGLPIILKNMVEIIKILKKYLKSHNNGWICLACNDIYMLIKICPSINNIINKNKVRDVLFDLTKNENDEVRFKAIQALYASIFSEWN